MMHFTWSRLARAVGAVVLLVGLIAVAGGVRDGTAQQAKPVQQVETETGDTLPVAIHAGTCAEPVAEPVFDLGNAAAIGTDEDDDENGDDEDVADEMLGTPPEQPPLTTEETIGATFDDLFDSPHVIAVHAAPEEFGALVACGDLGGVEEDGRVVVSLRPIGDSGVAGVAIFNEDEEGILGIGEDEVRVTVYIVPDVTMAPAAAPVASPVAMNRVEVGLTEFTIDMPSEIPAGEVTFIVTNTGSIDHNFEVEGQGIEEEFAENLQPGETQELTLTLDPGTYEIYCPVGNHAEQGMELELTVTE